MRKLVVILTFTLFCCLLQAQEFHCAVSVNVEKLGNTTQTYETADPKKFAEEMKDRLETFVNNRRWTNLELEQAEKLECSIALVISRRTSQTDFVGQLTMQLRRPVFNSSYTSGLFNHMDVADFAFTYDETRPLDFEPNTFFDNLTSAIGFYAYVMLGIYFDSYGMMGGTPFYDMASTIAQVAGSAPSSTSHWRSDGNSKARYWMAENHTNASYEGIREAYYLYNRMGLDLMTKDQQQARNNIIQALKKVQEVNKKKHNLLVVNQFVEVKIQELVSIFTPAPPEEKRQVFAIIKEISPLQTSKMKDWDK